MCVCETGSGREMAAKQRIFSTSFLNYRVLLCFCFHCLCQCDFVHFKDVDVDVLLFIILLLHVHVSRRDTRLRSIPVMYSQSMTY